MGTYAKASTDLRHPQKVSLEDSVNDQIRPNKTESFPIKDGFKKGVNFIGIALINKPITSHKFPFTVLSYRLLYT